MTDVKTYERVTRAKLTELLDAYAGAVAHASWVGEFGSADDAKIASAAEREAREAIEKAVLS